MELEEFIQNVKPGDSVILCSKRPSEWNRYGEMDKYLNTWQVVRNIHWRSGIFTIEDDKEWEFSYRDVVGVRKQSSLSKIIDKELGL